MKTLKDPHIPLRIPPALLKEIENVAEYTNLSKQDVMRLGMRIGLVDLAAAEHDLPGIVQRIADDKGVSFQSYAKAVAARDADEGALSKISATIEQLTTDVQNDAARICQSEAKKP